MEHKKGGLRPLFDFVSSLEGDRKLRADSAGRRPPAASSERRDGSPGQFLVVSQILAIDRNAVPIV